MFAGRRRLVFCFSNSSCWEVIIIKQIHTFTSNILFESCSNNRWMCEFAWCLVLLTTTKRVIILDNSGSDSHLWTLKVYESLSFDLTKPSRNIVVKTIWWWRMCVCLTFMIRMFFFFFFSFFFLNTDVSLFGFFRVSEEAEWRDVSLWLGLVQSNRRRNSFGTIPRDNSVKIVTWLGFVGISSDEWYKCCRSTTHNLRELDTHNVICRHSTGQSASV